MKNNITRCFDKFGREILEENFLDVQTDPIARKVYKKDDGQLYFTPYGKEDRVSAFFKTDLVKCDENLKWIPYDGS